MPINDKCFLQCLQYITKSSVISPRHLVSPPNVNIFQKTSGKLNPVDAKSVYEHSYKGTKYCPVPVNTEQ